MDAAEHDFTPAERALHDSVVRKFGVLRAGIRPDEGAAHWLQRVKDAGLFREIKRSAFRDISTYRALMAAEKAGTEVRVTTDPEPDGLTFQKPKTLDEYRVAVKAGEVAGKPVRYE